MSELFQIQTKMCFCVCLCLYVYMCTCIYGYDVCRIMLNFIIAIIVEAYMKIVASIKDMEAEQEL